MDYDFDLPRLDAHAGSAPAPHRLLAAVDALAEQMRSPLTSLHLYLDVLQRQGERREEVARRAAARGAAIHVILTEGFAWSVHVLLPVQSSGH